MIYGIAERRFNDGYIKAEIVAADENEIGRRPEYTECETEYCKVTFHWLGEDREAVETRFASSKIAFYTEDNENSIGDAPVKDFSETDFVVMKDLLVAEHDLKPGDITAKLEISER